MSIAVNVAANVAHGKANRIVFRDPISRIAQVCIRI